MKTVKILKIEKRDYKGYVYNFEVETNHNYLANNILVSNCHEDSKPTGLESDLMKFKDFFKRFQPGTELALGGGDLLTMNPTFEAFLEMLSKQGIIVNVTINQSSLHSQKSIDRLNSWIDNKLVYGVGISVTYIEGLQEVLDSLHAKENVVLHVIAGLANSNLEALAGHNYKVLILGYKNIRRGGEYYEFMQSTIDYKINVLKELLPNYLNSNAFKVLSFDNLALTQLGVKEMIPADEWELYYMGDDGTHTMYIDLVNEQYALSSTSQERFALNPNDDIKDVFKTILDSRHAAN